MVAVVFKSSGDGWQQGSSKATEAKRRTQQPNEDEVRRWRRAGRSTAATMEKSKAAEHSTAAAMDNSEAVAWQDSEAATEQEQEVDAMWEDKSFKEQ
jgi:hypothetical protein